MGAILTSIRGNSAALSQLAEELVSVDTGRRQSPINIDPTKVQPDHELNRDRPLRVVYPTLMANLVIFNTGYGWKLEIPEMLAAKTELQGGPLKSHIYRITQFHCHWGPDINVGSEHTVNGKSYPAELHFVHWNTSQYTSPAVAMSQPNGLSVLAVFIDIGHQVNTELNKVLSQLDHILYKGDKKLDTEPINIGQLMPTNKSYWTYYGSLTTLPLFESVTWILYTTPIWGTVDQIAKFRELIYTTRSESMFGGRLLENYRQTQPLNERLVRLCSAN